jgi:hypothetical protein
MELRYHMSGETFWATCSGGGSTGLTILGYIGFMVIICDYNYTYRWLHTTSYISWHYLAHACLCTCLSFVVWPTGCFLGRIGAEECWLAIPIRWSKPVKNRLRWWTAMKPGYFTLWWFNIAIENDQFIVDFKMVVFQFVM